MDINNINPMDSIDNRIAHPSIWLDETLHCINFNIQKSIEYLGKDEYANALSILNQTSNYVNGLRDGNRFMKDYNKLKEVEKI